MLPFGSVADRKAIEASGPYAAQELPVSIHACLTRTRDGFADNPAISFQILSDPRSRAVTLTWAEFHQSVTRTANLFRDLGIGPDDTVACLLPNCPEAAIVTLAGATAGIVSPINPLLGVPQIAALLRETGARVLVTLKPFPKSDIAQKAALAVADAPAVKHVLEVDLAPYLDGVKGLAARLLRPRRRARHDAKIHDFDAEARRYPQDHLTFDDPQQDRVAARFHTGGTTGNPRIAQHRYSGMIYNGWLARVLWAAPDDVLLCPLPLFHVFAAYPVLMGCVGSGAHMVILTPAGYRGEGVIDNLWKLIERWQASFLISVPTAIAALIQRPVDADISSLKITVSGSAALPAELYRRYCEATGLGIVEGYGLTEVTCLVSGNPPFGVQKVGSAGIAFPYTDLRIINHEAGQATDCAAEEIGEICISNPGVNQTATYMDPALNVDLLVDGRWLRTGDLGRIDADGYLWITGRLKDIINRGGNTIDPAVIEEALLTHPAVALACAIGQPDSFSGELPCAYVELMRGASVSVAELLAYAAHAVPERAAVPKHIEILDVLPKTAIGKTYRPALRAMAIRRVFDAALAGTGARVRDVRDDPRRGLMAFIACNPEGDRAAITTLLAAFVVPWDWADAAAEEGDDQQQ